MMDVVPDAVPDAVPEAIPEAVPQAVPCGISGYKIPGELPHAIVHDVPNVPIHLLSHWLWFGVHALGLIDYY